MNEIELYVHTAQHHDPKLIRIRQEASIGELLGTALPESKEELLVFLEEESDPLDHVRKLQECGVTNRRHVHCHHCHKIEVVVFYNGERRHSFSPSTTVEKVLLWALNAFHLKGSDALDKVLRLQSAPNEPLPEATHIGSLTDGVECQLRLDLTGKIDVNG